MSEQPIRIGIVGAGGIVTRRHLPGLEKLAGVEVVAVCNRRRETARAVAEDWAIPHVADTPQALLAREDIDAVLIGTQPHLHRELTLAALEAGRHVFCQARMARTLAEARDMLAAARARPDRVTMLCPAPHVQPGQAFVAGALQSGELGEVRLVRLQQMSEAGLNPQAPFHWRMDREISGYNVLTLGIFAEILHRWVGKARTVAASGRIFTPVRPSPETGQPRQVDLPESLVVTGELENGAHYVYTFSSVAAHTPPDLIEIYGTRGTLTYELGTHVLRMAPVAPRTDLRVGRVTEKAPLPVVEIPPAERGDWRVEADFVSAIRHGTPVFPDFRDGVDYMEFTEAAGRALETGSTVTLPLD